MEATGKESLSVPISLLCFFSCFSFILLVVKNQKPKKISFLHLVYFFEAAMSSSSPFVVPPFGEIVGFEQESGEAFKIAWERILELHSKMQLKMNLDTLIMHFYFGLLPIYQNALDTMVGGTFFKHDAEKAYKILNGLAQFPQEDRTGVLTRLDKIEESLKSLTLDPHSKEPLHVELKNDWEPFVELSIGGEKFRAYCDLGSCISVMPKIVYDILKLAPLENCDLDVHFADSSMKKSLGKVDDVLIMVNNNLVPVEFVVLDIECNPSCPIVLGRPFLRTVGADRKSTRLNSSHSGESRMPSSA